MIEEVKGKSGSRYSAAINEPATDSAGNRTINVKNTIEGNKTILVTGTITWTDNNNQDGTRPRTVTVRVMNGDIEADLLTVIPETSGRWTYMSRHLTKYVSKETDELINYTVEELQPNGYNISISPAVISDIGNREINITNILQKDEP